MFAQYHYNFMVICRITLHVLKGKGQFFSQIDYLIHSSKPSTIPCCAVVQLPVLPHRRTGFPPRIVCFQRDSSPPNPSLRPVFSVSLPSPRLHCQPSPMCWVISGKDDEVPAYTISWRRAPTTTQPAGSITHVCKLANLLISRLAMRYTRRHSNRVGQYVHRYLYHAAQHQ